MRRDTSFSERKLTPEEFADKYWAPCRGVTVPYQYHTGRIEDGRDEREQFVFNNIRALYDMIHNLKRSRTGSTADLLELEVDKKWSEAMRELEALREEVQSLKKKISTMESTKRGSKRILRWFLRSG